MANFTTFSCRKCRLEVPIHQLRQQEATADYPCPCLLFAMVWEWSCLLLFEQGLRWDWDYRPYHPTPHKWHPPDLEFGLGSHGLFHGRARRSSCPVHDFCHWHARLFYPANGLLRQVRERWFNGRGSCCHCIHLLVLRCL